MSATKEAMVAMEHAHGKDLDVSIFCMDVRAFGKEFDAYVDRARDEAGVKYIRAIPSRVVEMPGSKNPRIRYFDESGVEQQQEYDLVVLSVGLQVPQSVRDMAGRLGLGPEPVRLRRHRSPCPDGHQHARSLRGRRFPGAQGHPRVGGPGLGRGRLRDGAAGSGPRLAGHPQGVSLGA